MIQCEEEDEDEDDDDDRAAMLSSSKTVMTRMILDRCWSSGYSFRAQFDALPNMPDQCGNAWVRKDGIEK